jgi:hypothetical protein
MPPNQAERPPQPFLLGRFSAIPPTLTAPFDLGRQAAVDLFAQGKSIDGIFSRCARPGGVR